MKCTSSSSPQRVSSRGPRLLLLVVLLLSCCRSAEAQLDWGIFVDLFFQVLWNTLTQIYCWLPILGWIFCPAPDEGPPTQLTKLVPHDGGQSDAFGLALDISGNTVVISSPNHGEFFEGGVYVFTTLGEIDRNNKREWIQQPLEHLRHNVTGNPYEFSGTAVAIDGDTIVLGAPGTITQGRDSGAVQVFLRNPDPTAPPEASWVAFQIILPPVVDAVGLFFGTYLALSGNTLAVASWLETDQQGVVYVYTRNTATALWSLQTTLSDQDDGAANDHFGQALALEGDVLVVGAHGHNSSRGAAYVYTRDPATDSWSLSEKLVPDDAPPPTNSTEGEDAAAVPRADFGIAVALSEGTLAVSAHTEDDGAGAVYVYARNETFWMLEAKLQIGDRTNYRFDFFGRYLALSGNAGILAVGGSGEDVFRVEEADVYVDQGRVYVFTRQQEDTPTWNLQSNFSSLDGDPGDFFGYALALEGKTLLVGAPEQDGLSTSVSPEDTGAAYLIENVLDLPPQGLL